VESFCIGLCASISPSLWHSKVNIQLKFFAETSSIDITLVLVLANVLCCDFYRLKCRKELLSEIEWLRSEILQQERIGYHDWLAVAPSSEVLLSRALTMLGSLVRYLFFLTLFSLFKSLSIYPL
jgi:hypothetical protein